MVKKERQRIISEKEEDPEKKLRIAIKKEHEHIEKIKEQHRKEIEKYLEFQIKS